MRKTQSCTEKYGCLRACKSCFTRKRKESVTNLITLDGMSHFPKEFLDLKSFNSNKAQALNDIESSLEDIEQTAHGAKDQSQIHRASSAVAGALPAENRLLGINDDHDNRLINSRPSLNNNGNRPTDQVFSNDNLIRLGSEPMPNTLSNDIVQATAAANNL